MSCLTPNPRMQFLGANGQPLAAGFVFTYAAGTTTPLATYTDSTLVTPNTNPVVLDSNGSAVIWLGASAYKFVVEDSLSNVISTTDQIAQNLPGSIPGSALANNTITATQIANNTITAAQIANQTITATQIQNSTITATQLANGAVGEAQLNQTQDWSQYPQTVEVLFQSPWDFSDQRLYGMPQLPYAAPAQLSQPATIPAGQGNAIAYSPGGEFLAVGSSSSPYLTIYQRAGTTYTALSGVFSTNSSTAPATPTSQVTSLAWSPCGRLLAVGTISSPYAVVYLRNTFNFIAINNFSPATHATAALAWSPNGQFLCQATATSPYLNVWGAQSGFLLGLSGTLFGQLVALSNINLLTNTTTAINTAVNGIVSAANQGLLEIQSAIDAAGSGRGFSSLSPLSASPTTSITSISFSPNGQYIAIGLTATPFILVYQISGQTFTALSAPASLPPGIVYGCSWSYDSTLLALSHVGSPFMSVYQVSGTTLTKLAPPTGGLPAGQGNAIAFSPNGQLLAIATNTAPFLQLYQRTGTAFAQVTALATAPASVPSAVCWSPNQEFLSVAVTSTPYVLNYQSTGAFPSNALLFARSIQRA